MAYDFVTTWDILILFWFFNEGLHVQYNNFTVNTVLWGFR
jgi:hypothetical protein